MIQYEETQHDDKETIIIFNLYTPIYDEVRKNFNILNEITKQYGEEYKETINNITVDINHENGENYIFYFAHIPKDNKKDIFIIYDLLKELLRNISNSFYIRLGYSEYYIN